MPRNPNAMRPKANTAGACIRSASRACWRRTRLPSGGNHETDPISAVITRSKAARS
jgi:hypothetical protein